MPGRNFAADAHSAVHRQGKTLTPSRGVEDAAPYGGNPWTVPFPQALTAATPYALPASNYINQKETACFRRSLYFLPVYRAV